MTCALVIVLVGCHTANNGDDDPWSPRPDGRSGDALVEPDACTPITCEAVGANCGEIAEDGCGGTLACGTCVAPATCGGQDVEHVCAIPIEERTCTGGWCWESPSPIPFEPSAMFARTSTDVWAVGSRGVALRHDGVTWRAVDAGTTQELHDIWMASATDGWLVGAGGVIRRWNGTAWTTVASGTTATFRGVWGLSSTNVWIVGDGVARRWNGTSLTTPFALATPMLEDVFAASENDVFAVGDGRVWTHTGTSWSAQTPEPSTFTTYRLHHIAGTASEAFAIGRSFSFLTGEELIFGWDGQTWTRIQHTGDPELTDAFADAGRVYGVSDESIIDLEDFARTLGPASTNMQAAVAVQGDAFVATTGGQLWRGTAGAWTADGYGPRVTLGAIGAIGDGVWFGGDLGTVLEWRGGLIAHPPVSTYRITSITGTAREDVWLADAANRLHHFDGVAWMQVQPPPFVRTEVIHASGGEVRVFGEGIFRRTATGWEEEPITGDPDVTWYAADDHEGEVYAVGYEDTLPPVAHVARRTNGTWTELPLPATPVLCGLAVVGPNDIWAVGSNGARSPDSPVGRVSHWNGATWTTIERAGTTSLCAIDVVGGEVFVSGTPGDIHRRAATGLWTIERPLATGSVHALRATATELWVAGDHGAVLRR